MYVANSGLVSKYKLLYKYFDLLFLWKIDNFEQFDTPYLSSVVFTHFL